MPDDNSAQPCNIRRAEPRDLDRLVAITRRTHLEHVERVPDVFHVKSDIIQEQVLKGFLSADITDAADDHFSILMCDCGGDVAGYVMLRFKPGRINAELHDLVGTIYDISLDPDYRGQGIGRRLLVEAVDCARRRGCTILRAETWGGNTASDAMFERQGFNAVGRDYALRLAPAIEAPVPERPRWQAASPPAQSTFLLATSFIGQIAIFFFLFQLFGFVFEL